MKEYLIKLVLLNTIIFSIMGCGYPELKTATDEDRYPVGTTLDDGRFMAFAYQVPYKDTTLSDALLDNVLSFDEYLDELELIDTLRDGGSKLYKYGKIGKFGDYEFYTMVCNSSDGVKDIYVSRTKENLIDKCSLKYDDLEGVSMKIKKGTLTKTSATLIITDKSDRDNTYGLPYRIDKYEDGKWKKLPSLIDNLAWNDIGYKKNEKDTLEFKVNWQGIYGKLKKGKYRIVKDTSEAVEYPTHFITTEFEIK